MFCLISVHWDFFFFFFSCLFCSRVELHNFLYLSMNPVLVNSCVLEWLGNIILTVNYSSTSHVCWYTKNIIEISKLYWYSLFPLKDVPFVHNKHICLICGSFIMFGNSWFKLAFPPLSAHSTSTSKVCLTMLPMIIHVSNQIAPIINMCTTLRSNSFLPVVLLHKLLRIWESQANNLT